MQKYIKKIPTSTEFPAKNILCLLPGTGIILKPSGGPQPYFLAIIFGYYFWGKD